MNIPQVNQSVWPQGHKSKWGFHTVSKATLKKLRHLNKVYQMALGQAKNWLRWDRKAEQNKVERPKIYNEKRQVVGYGEKTPWLEPTPCPVFSEKVTKKVKQHPTKGYHYQGQDYTYIEMNSHHIQNANHQARHPFARLEDVPTKPILSEEKIDELYEATLSWYNTMELISETKK